MPRLSVSSSHAFLLGIMALVVAVLCLTIRVLTENLESRIIMAGFWVTIAAVWLVQAWMSRRAKENAQRQSKEGVNR